MEIASYNGKEINLQYYPRESFQMLYEASLRDEVTCISCQKPVKLYLGIQQRPHFYHTTETTTFACEAAVHTRAQEKQKALVTASAQYAEQGGFRIPKSRSITEERSVSLWKEVQPAKGITDFMKQNEQTLHSILNEEQFPLDASQYKAVTCTEGPLLILAGAGSGKTRVLTARTAYMIQEKGIDPKSIMLVTFTAKAAHEMKERLQRFSSLPKTALHSLLVGTFHSIFYRILMHHEPERWSSQYLLKYDWQIDRILKEAGAEIGIDEKEFPYDQAMQQIGYWKNTLTHYDSITPASPWEDKAVYLYKRYEQMKQERGLFDFDDMLYGCYELLRTNEELLARYQNRFRYFLIDEFQDINKVQYKIMQLLSKQTNNVCAVGDDDQSIYAFRGSDPSFILHFDKDYPNAEIVTLSQNYRSSHSIVTVANKVIRLNKQRRPKQMKAQFHSSSPPSFFFPYDEEEEATMIVTDIKERIEKGATPSDFAILYRTHSASRAIFERLSQSFIPFVIERDADSFYQRRIVRSLLAYLRLSVDEDNVNAISDLLVALFLKQSVLQDLKAISILQDCSLVRALSKLTNIQPFQQKKLQKMVPLFRTLKDAPPLVAIEIIEREMGFSDFIKKRGNEGNAMDKGSDDLRDLKVVARKFTTVLAFLAHVDHMIAMNEEMKKLSKTYTDAVQLLTIHRSKGLEYKHVYLLGAVDGSLPHDFSLDSFREGDSVPLEEERRLTYVAITRAQETLYVSVPSMRRGRTAYPSRFIKGLLQ
ncbi:UvrD-helicase domain-containing protein [Ectobacillus panaciterrae]|uniref:UvrD-helicase domain-containing protein n=1 Tax=Ectobacillus panaciterrae TaxID=363872 RepID=UPI0004139912|nr:ATP-dependent helicase [Ectobacillus panaciterrae]